MAKNFKYGIDLGTTYSCIAYTDEYGEVKVINNAEGENITPSVVRIEGGNAIVGRVAKNGAVVYPDKTVEMVKRSMGELRKDGTPVKIRIEGREYMPQEISALILKKLVNDANKALNASSKDVVITVPAYFGEEARKATKEAAEIVGLNLINIVDEPTAAAICYQSVGNDGKDKNILVYDLGGGTFDISLVELKNGNVKVKYHDGNKKLGGKDWDNKIVEYIFETASEKTGKNIDDLFGDQTIYQDTLSSAEEKIKKTLSKQAQASMIVKGLNVEVSLTRDKFDELTKPLLMQTITIIDRLLNEKNASFDEILLVGGSSRMPQVRVALEKYNKKINSYREDEAVACGAAIYANPTKSMNIAINSAKSYGIKTVTNEASARSEEDPSYEMTEKDHVISNVVLIHSPLPIDIEESFETTHDNQTAVQINVFENISEDEIVRPEQYGRYNAKELGSGTLKLSPKLPKGSPIKVRFTIKDATGLFVTGTDPKSGNYVNISIKLGSQMSQEEKDKFSKRFRF